jgi:hypothetical protein
MSFLPAVHREILNRQPNDPVRMTLEFLLTGGAGKSNAVTLRTIVAHLNERGIDISENQWQTTVLADSRRADFFIGSGGTGYFLIETVDDAREMADFYDTRIQAEQENVANLRRQAGNVGWTV